MSTLQNSRGDYVDLYKNEQGDFVRGDIVRLFVCLFVCLLYVPSQQLWSLRDGQFTKPHFFLGRLEQADNQ